MNPFRCFSITGNDNVVRDCTISNVFGNGVVVTGEGNLVTGCDISRTGRGGIILTGGDRETLKPGGNGDQLQLPIQHRR